MLGGDAITIASAAFLAVGGFLFGYDSGIIGSTIALPHFNEYFDSPSDDLAGGIVSSFQGGAVLGTMINMVSPRSSQGMIPRGCINVANSWPASHRLLLIYLVAK